MKKAKRRKATSPARRITRELGAKRNTRAAAEPMRASAQLDAFPPSDNARRRQSSRLSAVVAIRLTGDVIAKLDVEAERAKKEPTSYRGGGWHSRRDVTRTDVIKRALRAYLDGGAS